MKSCRAFCQIAIKKMGHSGADVVRFLGTRNSAVNPQDVSDELPEVVKYIQIILEPAFLFMVSFCV